MGNVLGAQAHFSTVQQSFSSSSGPKKQTCSISKSVFEKKFPWEARKLTPAKMVRFLSQVQTRLIHYQQGCHRSGMKNKDNSNKIRQVNVFSHQSCFVKRCAPSSDYVVRFTAALV